MVDLVLRAIPYAPHRRAVAELLVEAREHPLIIGAMLIGSLGRGNALPGSDIDILYLVRDGHESERLFSNHERDGVTIEFHYRDLAGAREQLDREPTWLYAYLDSRILHDPDGSLAQLVRFARERFDAYRSDSALKRRYAFMVDRTRHKLQTALDAEDALRAGGVASTYAQVIIEGLWVSCDRPRLGVSEMWLRLPDLAGLPGEYHAQLQTLFLEGPMERARAGVALCDWIVNRLGGPILDPYQHPEE